MNGAKVLADTLKFHGKIETLRLGWCQVCHESCNHLVSPEPLCYLRTSSLLLLELRWTSKISLSSLSTFPSQSYCSCFSCPPSPLHTWWSLLDPVCSFLHWLLVNAEVSHTVTETKLRSYEPFCQNLCEMKKMLLRPHIFTSHRVDCLEASPDRGEGSGGYCWLSTLQFYHLNIRPARQLSGWWCMHLDEINYQWNLWSFNEETSLYIVGYVINV